MQPHNFKTCRQLARGQTPWIIIKGWNAHLQKFCNDRITNYSRLRQWFRRMLCWARHHPLQLLKKTWVQKQQRLKPPLEQPYKKWVPKQQPSHLSSAQRTQIHQYTDTIPNFSAGINWHSKEPHKSPSQLDPFIQIAPSPSQEIPRCKIPPDSSTEEKTHFTSFEKLVLQ